MKQRKAIAQAITVLMVTTASAVALNIAVVQATSADTGSDSAVDPTESTEPQTVVIEIPADPTPTPDPAPVPVSTTPVNAEHLSSAQKLPTAAVPVGATATTTQPVTTAAPPPPTTAAPTTVAPTTAPRAPEHEDEEDSEDDHAENTHTESHDDD